MNQSLRILLWDLDGTLVRGKRFGTFKDYTVPMLKKVFGTAGCLAEKRGMIHEITPNSDEINRAMKNIK